MDIDIEGARMHYVEAGDPKGMPVVFIHGFPFSHKLWRPQLDALSRGRRLIAYDVRGHGKSAVGDGLFTIELFVDDLLALLDALKVERAVLCGLSMGGYIALRAAERAPQKLAGLILADTRAEPDTNQGKVLRAGAMGFVLRRGVTPFAEEFVKNLFSPMTLAAGRPCVEEIKAIMKENSALGVRGTLLALAARPDAAPGLAAIKAPTLILVGERDTVTPLACSEALRQGISGAKLAVIPEAGHLSNLEQPERFNAEVERFLEEAYAGRGR
jgi:pimeloyl-ACP methyl ester carboxylesterase